MDSFFGGLSGRVSSDVSSDVCMGEGSRLSGRVSSEVLSEVCMGEGSQILLDSFCVCRAGAENQ